MLLSNCKFAAADQCWPGSFTLTSTSGSPTFNNGASATIGVVAPIGRAQFSLNTAAVFNGDYIDITSQEDIDEFRFSGVAAQRVDVALDALDSNSIGASFMRLLTETNAVLATATTKPLSTATTVANYDLGLVDLCAASHRQTTPFVSMVGTPSNTI